MTIKSSGLFLSYLIAALLIMSLIQSPGLVNERAGVNSMANFAAHKPFVYRTLVPILVRTIEAITPGFISDPINKKFSEKISKLGQTQSGTIPPQKIAELSQIGYRAVVFELLNLSFLVGFLYCLRFLTRTLKLLPDSWCDLIPLGMVFVLPIYFNYGNFMYDFAALFFFALGLICLYKGDWKVYLPIFAIAILNKETAILLAVIFALFHYSRLARKQYWQLLITQIIMFGIIKVALAIIFANNPGNSIEWHLTRNLTYLSDIANYFRFDPIGIVPLAPGGLNIPLPRGLNLLIIIFVGLLVLHGWKSKSQFLKVSLLIVPIFFVIGLLMGYIDELRSYIEILPVVYLLALSGLYKLIWERKAFESE